METPEHQRLKAMLEAMTGGPIEFVNVGAQEETDWPPYEAAPTYFADADMLEYVTEDIPTIARQIDPSFTLLVAMDDRSKVVGFQLYAPKRAFEA